MTGLTKNLTEGERNYWFIHTHVVVNNHGYIIVAGKITSKSHSLKYIGSYLFTVHANGDKVSKRVFLKEPE